MTDRQFEVLIETLKAIADDINSIKYDGVSAGSFSYNDMHTFLKNLDRIATALEEGAQPKNITDEEEEEEAKEQPQTKNNRKR